jgi:predicted transcriptional regulator
LAQPVHDAALQDGDNTNNIITVLPRDATDNAIRERLLSQTGALTAASSVYVPL